MPTDSHYMLRAIELASGGFYTVRSNPRVGCVIVNHNKVVGEGWHQFAGGPHAEFRCVWRGQRIVSDRLGGVYRDPALQHHGRDRPVRSR